MTEETLWTSLEAAYRTSDWTGVAVLADRFEELEQPELADTVRWLSQREAEGTVTLWPDGLKAKGWWFWYNMFSSTATTVVAKDFPTAVLLVHEQRVAQGGTL